MAVHSRRLRLRSSSVVALLVLGALAGGSLWALSLGQDANFDQLRAHYYGLFWLTHLRRTRDVFPAAEAGVLPFFWNLPWFFIVTRVGPRLTLAYLGALHAIDVVLLGALTWRLVRGRVGARLAVGAVAVSVACGACGPAFVGEFATTFGDNATAIFFLAGLTTLLWSGTVSSSTKIACVSFALIGFGFGLKLTNGPWAVACVVALCIAAEHGQRRRIVGAAGLGLVGGVLAAYGAWAALMWRWYGSPLFPLFNGFLHSPAYVDSNFRDERWVIGSPVDLVALPVRWITKSRVTGEAASRDWRWLLLDVLALICLCTVVIRRRPVRPRPAGSRGAPTSPHPIRQAGGLFTAPVCAFFLSLLLVGLPLSLVQLAYTRYLVIGELLCGIGVLAALDILFRSRGLVVVSTAIVAAILLASSATDSWGRSDIASSWFQLRIDDPPVGALVFVIDQQDDQYALPFLGHSNDFALIGATDERFPQDYRRLSAMVDTSQGRTFLLSTLARAIELPPPVTADLARYALRFDDSTCRPLGGVNGPLWLCRLTPSSP